MTEPTCPRFEPDGLSRWDDGAVPDDHERGCDDCQRARASYARMAGALAKLPALEPPAGWEERVMARVARPETAVPGARPRTRLLWALAAALVPVVAAATLIPWYTRGVARPPEEAVGLTQEILTEASGRRADSPVVGDHLKLTALTGAAAHAELRIYRGEHELVLRCPGDMRCRIDAKGFEAELRLESKGSYRALLLVAAVPLAEPMGSLDEDVRAAHALGARAEVGLAVDVE